MTDDDIMKELESGDTFDEKIVPIDRRIASVRTQMQDWDNSAYSAKIAFQTNHQLGLTEEELAPLIKQFTRARKASKYLAEQLASLESERKVSGRLQQTSAA